jgi:hypothetical protein
MDDSDDSDSDPLSPFEDQSKHRRWHHLRGPSWKAIAGYVVLSLLGMAFIAMAACHVVFGDLIFDHAQRSPGSAARRGLVWELEGVNLLGEVSEDRVNLLVKGRAGVDVSRAIGWDDREEGAVKTAMVRWAVNRAKGGRVKVAGVTLFDSSGKEALVSVDELDRLRLPLRFPKQGDDDDDHSWLRDFELSIPARIVGPDSLAAFLQTAWESKKVDIRVLANDVDIRTGLKWIKPFTIDQVNEDISFDGKNGWSAIKLLFDLL